MAARNEIFSAAEETGRNFQGIPPGFFTIKLFCVILNRYGEERKNFNGKPRRNVSSEKPVSADR